MPKGLLRSGIVAAFDKSLWEALQVQPGMQFEIDNTLKPSLAVGIIKASRGTPGTPAAIGAEKDADGNYALLVKIINANAIWLLKNGSNADTTVNIGSQAFRATKFLTSSNLSRLEMTGIGLLAAGTDGNINIDLTPKGTGIVNVVGGLTASGILCGDTITDGFFSATGGNFTNVGAITGTGNYNTTADMTCRDLNILGGDINSFATITNLTYGNGVVAAWFFKGDSFAPQYKIASTKFANLLTCVLTSVGAAWTTTGYLAFTSGAGSIDFIASAPNQTINMTSSRTGISETLEVANKSKLTIIGGHAIKLTNKTGAVTIAGQLVKADTANDDAVILTAADDLEPIGVFLESGKVDGITAWVVVSGIADVAMEDNTAATRGNWVRTSITEAGYADATNAAAPQPINQTHFTEIGHCIESVAAGGGGTHILARCVLHFN